MAGFREVVRRARISFGEGLPIVPLALHLLYVEPASHLLASATSTIVLLMRGVGDFRVERAGSPHVRRHQLRLASWPYDAPG